MTSRRLMVAAAAVLATADLVQKAFEPVDGHPRGTAYAAVAIAIAAVIVAVVPWIPSRALAVAGAVAAAGAFGDGVSALIWRAGVPNPIVTEHMAFNVADVYAVVGAMGLVCGAIVFAARNPQLLHERVF